jgi:type IV secretion system protein VirB9
MMRFKLILTAAVGLGANLVAGSAAATPFAAVYDEAARVQRVAYQDNLILRIAGFPNSPLVIELHPDEPISDVASPEAAPVEIVRKGSRLFARVLSAPKEPVTVLVTTKTRSYVFDFVAGTPAQHKDRVSKVVFSYPAPPAPVPAPTQAAAPEKARFERAQDVEPVVSGYRNNNYSLQVVSETVDIRPREAFDDGRFTWFKFPNNIEIPAIYRSIPGSKEEWLVNSHRHGDYVVLHAVSALWTFRLGGSVLGVFNDSYEPDGVPPSGGTTVLGLERGIKP